MRLRVIDELDGSDRSHPHAVHLDAGDALHDPVGVPDGVGIARGAVPHGPRVRWPASRNAWVHVERAASQPHAEDPLEGGAVHPTRRAGVPGPSTAADMWRL